jgi:membrane protein implicated in regulation of membrane protease activity
VSLKTFHLFFITISTLLCAWVGVWAVRHGREALAALFVALGVALITYGVRFRRKLKELKL